MVLPLLASYAAKKTFSYAKNKAQNRAKQFAAQKTRQMANVAKKRVNSGITGLVNKHMGNNPQARALANQLKTHISGKINSAHTTTQNQIKTASGFKLF